MPGMYKQNLEEANKKKWGGAPKLPLDHPLRPRTRYPVHEDAFSTLMMWLHGRIEATR
jgi:hypothetical protein